MHANKAFAGQSLTSKCSGVQSSMGLPTQFSSAFARRCLATAPHSSRKSRSSVVQAGKIKPAYNKYRTRKDIEADYVKQWKDITARDSEPRRMTPFTFLWFVPVFFKYHIVPGPVRYAWWLTWTALLALGYQIRKRLVLQGAQLDVRLLRSGKDAKAATFSRKLVLQRLHGRVSMLDTLKYRAALIQGKEPPAQEETAPQAAEQVAEPPASDAQQDKYAVMNDLLPDLATYARGADVSLELDEATEAALQADPVPG